MQSQQHSTHQAQSRVSLKKRPPKSVQLTPLTGNRCSSPRRPQALTALRACEMSRGAAAAAGAIIIAATCQQRRIAAGAQSIENDRLRVTVLVEGGHIAEVFDKRAGVNPLWTPPWPSIEPSTSDPTRTRVRRWRRVEAARRHHGAQPVPRHLRRAIRSRSGCWSARAWRSVDRPYEIEAAGDNLTMRAGLPLASLEVERHVELSDGAVWIAETVDNAEDRQADWVDAARDARSAVP